MSYSENDSTAFEEISSAIDQLTSQSKKNEKDYEILEEILKNLLLRNGEYNKSLDKYEEQKARLTPQRNSQVMQRIDNDTKEMQIICATFKVSRTVFLHNLNLIVENADYVCDEIIDKHLRKWRENQILGHSNEDQARENLNKIQNWCENLAKVLMITRKRLRIGSMYLQVVTEFDDTMQGYLQQVFKDVTNLLVSLMKHTIVIEKQPPQVLSSNETFSTTVRLLNGNALNIKQINPSVTVSIVSEQQAQSFENIEEESDLNCGKLNYCAGQIKFDKKTSKFVATFDALKVAKITESEDNDTIEKFGLLFQSTIRDNEIEIHIKALSMPFVVNVDESRKPASNDVISWDNVFPVFDRPPFDLVNFMNRLTSKLFLKMQVYALNETRLVAPKLKLIMKPFMESMHKFALSRICVYDVFSGYEHFFETFLCGSKIEFLKWFYSAIELTQNNLCELWNENYIIGFIDEKSAEELLLGCEPGTFLLRLSDSENVGLVIDYCKLNENDEKYVFHYEPLTTKDLKLCSLPDRILSLVELKMLYQSTLPHIDKHNAFDKYSSHQNEQNTESDPMKAYITLLSFSEIRFNFPIDKSLPAIEPLKYTNTTSPLSPPPRCNFFTRCWSRMNNGEDNDEYDLLS